MSRPHRPERFLDRARDHFKAFGSRNYYADEYEEIDVEVLANLLDEAYLEGRREERAEAARALSGQASESAASSD